MDLKKKKKDNIINHIIQFKKYWKHINLIGSNDFHFSNAYFKVIITLSLPPFWDSFRQPYVFSQSNGVKNHSKKNCSSQTLNGHIKEKYIWHKNLECQVTGLSLTQKRGLKKSYPLCAPQTKTKLKGDLYCKLCKLKNHSVEDCFHLDKTPCGSCRKYGHAAKECYGKGQKRTNNAKIKGSDKVTPKKCNKKEAHQATKTNEATYVAFAAIEAEENDMEGEFNYNMQSQVRNTIMI